jgi:hypothetical protein
MTLEAAFLSPQADDLFESVADFANATELEKLDVTSGQSAARKALGRAIEMPLGDGQARLRGLH